MTTRLLLAVAMSFFVSIKLGRSYYFVDNDCLSRYNCTLKPHLPCVATVFGDCPPLEKLTNWPSKPKNISVVQYRSYLRGRRCYGKVNVTWRVPYDASTLHLNGFTLGITCLAGHCVGRRECIHFNMTKAHWNQRDIIEKVQYSFDCLKQFNGKHHIDIFTLPKAHDGHNHADLMFTPDCTSLSSKAPQITSTHRPTSSTASGSVTTSGVEDTSHVIQKSTTESTTSSTASNVLPMLTWSQTSAVPSMLSSSQHIGGTYVVVAVVLGCFCGILLSTMLLYFIYKRHKTTLSERSRQKSSTRQNDEFNMSPNSSRDTEIMNDPGNVYRLPDQMPTTSRHTERFWDECTFKPPDLVDMDAMSTTTSEFNRAVHAINEEDAEQLRANGFRADFRPIASCFHRIDESEETCSISGTSI